MTKVLTFLSLFVVAVLSTDIHKVAIPSAGFPVKKHDRLESGQLNVMGLFLEKYGTKDIGYLIHSLAYTESVPNDVVPIITLGQAYLNKFEASKDDKDFEKALEYFEFASNTVVYPNWGNRWSSAPTLAYLLCGIQRAKTLQSSFRTTTLYEQGSVLATLESNFKLNDDYPYKPYDSSTNGDTKAEENAWEADLLAWSSQMYPDSPNAPLWEAKGRQLALFSVVRASDQLYFKNNQIVTVEEDFTLTNHSVRGNPYYEVGTVVLLRMGALAYHVFNKPIPQEYNHNVMGIYNRYITECTTDLEGNLIWGQPYDPRGDPTMFPLAFIDDPSFESLIVAQKAKNKYLWIPDGDDSLTTFVQDSKVFWYYLQGSYLWR